MKKNIPLILVLGIGVLTPALIGEPHAAAAVSMGLFTAYQDPSGVGARSPSAFEEAKSRLAGELASLTLSEKLASSGQRIPLAAVVHRDDFLGPGEPHAVTFLGAEAPLATIPCPHLQYATSSGQNDIRIHAARPGAFHHPRSPPRRHHR